VCRQHCTVLVESLGEEWSTILSRGRFCPGPPRITKTTWVILVFGLYGFEYACCIEKGPNMRIP